MPREGRLSRAPPEPPRPRHRATPAPHGNTRYGRRKNGPQRQTRRARGVERSPPGDGLLGPRERSGSPGREGFPTFSEASGIFFSCSLLEASVLWKPFFCGDETLSSPGDIVSYPRVFRLSGRAPPYAAAPAARAASCSQYCFR